jgi:hypothetical protein
MEQTPVPVRRGSAPSTNTADAVEMGEKVAMKLLSQPTYDFRKAVTPYIHEMKPDNMNLDVSTAIENVPPSSA